MPNYVKHKVVIIGEQTDVELVIASICNHDKGIGIDFEKVKPMPEELHNVVSPIQIISEAEYKKQIEERNTKIALGEPEQPFGMSNVRGITQKMYDDYIKRFGAADWYEWACKNWGTKWNACDSEPAEMGERNGMTTATLRFETAWSCAVPVLEEVSRNFPNVTVEVMFADEDWSYNCGTFELRNGELVDEYIPEGGSREAKKIATEMWGNFEDEDEDNSEDDEDEEEE